MKARKKAAKPLPQPVDPAVERFYIRLVGKLVSDYGVPKELVSMALTMPEGRRIPSMRIRAQDVDQLIAIVEHASILMHSAGVPPEAQRITTSVHTALTDDARVMRLYTAHVIVNFGQTLLSPRYSQQLTSGANV